jgi:hypothetical protein
VQHATDSHATGNNKQATIATDSHATGNNRDRQQCDRQQCPAIDPTPRTRQIPRVIIAFRAFRCRMRCRRWADATLCHAGRPCGKATRALMGSPDGTGSAAEAVGLIGACGGLVGVGVERMRQV